jgi:hypothetical protein
VRVQAHNSTLHQDTEKPLRRSSSLNRGKAPQKRRKGISPASKGQREKVRNALCVVCARDRYETPIHPAHLASRAQGGGDDPLDVVALCAEHHRAFDDGNLDLLPYLEPRHRDEVAQCVRHLGLIGALQRLTGERWAPERRAA